MFSIIIALVLSGVFILVGAWPIWTAIQQLREDDDAEQQDSALVRRFHRVQRLPLRDHSEEHRLRDAFHHAGSRELRRLAAGERKQR